MSLKKKLLIFIMALLSITLVTYASANIHYVSGGLINEKEHFCEGGLEGEQVINCDEDNDMEGRDVPFAQGTGEIKQQEDCEEGQSDKIFESCEKEEVVSSTLPVTSNEAAVKSDVVEKKVSNKTEATKPTEPTKNTVPAPGVIDYTCPDGRTVTDLDDCEESKLDTPIEEPSQTGEELEIVIEEGPATENEEESVQNFCADGTAVQDFSDCGKAPSEEEGKTLEPEPESQEEIRFTCPDGEYTDDLSKC